MRRHRKQLSGIGSQIGTSFTTAFGGYAVASAIGSSIKKIAGLEHELSKVKAVSGATDLQFESLKKNAFDLGRTTQFTAKEIATLQLELSKLGFNTSQILDSTDAVRKLATVADSELGESAKSMAGTLNSFNLEAKESERVANVMAESFSKSALDLEKFTVATSNSGAIANVLGVTLEENTARLGSLVNANIDASKAGTDLRKIYLELNKAGITYNEAMEQIQNSSDKAGTAQKLFGIRAAGAAVILSNQQEKVNKLTAELSDNNKELDKMVGIMEDNLLNDWKLLNSAIDGTIQKGGALNPILRGITKQMTELVNTFNSDNLSWFEKFTYYSSGAFLGLNSDVENYINHLEKTRQEQINLNNETLKIKESQAAFDDYTSAISQGLDTFKAYSDVYTEDSQEHLTLIKELYEARQKENTEIAAANLLTKKQIKLNEKLAQTLSDIRLSQGQNSNPVGGINDYRGILPFEHIVDTNLPDEFIEEDNKALEDAIAQGDKWKALQDKQVADWQNYSDNLNGIAQGTLADALASIGQTIGEGGGIGDAFGSVKAIIGKGMQSIGKAMIAYGVAQKVFQEALKKLNPYVAIAAGAAMVAAGAALSRSQSSFSSSMSGSPGPSGRFQGSASGQSINFNGKFVIKGRDLVSVIDEQGRLNSRATG